MRFLTLWIISSTFLTFLGVVEASTVDPPPLVMYMAPFLSGGGYSSEALTIALSMMRHYPSSITLQGVHHGDTPSELFLDGVPPEFRSEIEELLRDKKIVPPRSLSSNSPQDAIIFLCHSEPGAWNPPLWRALECPLDERRYGPSWASVPPSSRIPIVHVGRTMFETDRVPSGWIPRLNRMDEVWVPTGFQKDVFESMLTEAGEKAISTPIVVMPEPVDTDYYRPEGAVIDGLFDESKSPRPCIFLSIFKLEERKNWKGLVRAFVSEFRGDENVLLVLVISAYYNNERIAATVFKYVASLRGLFKSRDGRIPPIRILSNLPHEKLPELYRAADVFVLPTRGEGWGRPFAEAMSCGCPCIATDWSGPTEFMNQENSFLLRVEKLVPLGDDMPWPDHLWAEPDFLHLKELLRFVFENPLEVERVGNNARRDMLERYSMPVIGELFVKNFERLRKQEWEKREKEIYDEL